MAKSRKTGFKHDQASPSHNTKHIRQELLEGVNTQGNYVSYDIKASKVTDVEIKRMAKLANDRLYKLEKSGMSEYSREYQTVEHYAVGDPNNKGSIYNTDIDKGRIRFTGSTKDMTTNERSYLVNTLRNFLQAETSTVGGTRKAINKAFSTFQDNHQSSAAVQNMTVDEYQNLWKIYREQVVRDRMSHEAYNAFMTLVQETNLYELSDDQISEALGYINTSSSQSTAGILGDVYENAAWIKH